MEQNERLDLNKLSQRELLIILVNDMKDMKQRMTEREKEGTEIKVEMAVLKTKVALIAVAVSSIASIGVSIIINLI